MRRGTGHKRSGPGGGVPACVAPVPGAGRGTDWRQGPRTCSRAVTRQAASPIISRGDRPPAGLAGYLVRAVDSVIHVRYALLPPATGRTMNSGRSYGWS